MAAGTPGRAADAGYPTNTVGIAITPDGKTIFVANHSSTVTPISTATNTAGTPIKVCASPLLIAITPDGKAAYVMCSGA